MRRCCFDHRDAGRTHACLRRSGHRGQCRRAVHPGRRRGRLRASRCLDRHGADRCRANRRCLALPGGCRCGLRPDRHRGRHRHGRCRLDCRRAGRCHANYWRLARCGERRRAAGNPGRHHERLPASRSLRDRRCAGRCHASRRPCATIGRRHRGSYGGRRRDLWCPAPGRRANRHPARHPARHSPGLRLCGLRHGADDGHHGRRLRVQSVRGRGPTSPRLREVCAARHPGRATAADRSARDHRANRRVTTLGCRSGLRRHADSRRCENPHGRPGQGGPRLGPSRARSNGSGRRRCHPDARPRHRHHLSRSPDKDTNSLATATRACLKKAKKIGGEACCLSPNPTFCGFDVGGVLLSHTLSSAVPSALEGLASGFGMGPGVPHSAQTTDNTIHISNTFRTVTPHPRQTRMCWCVQGHTVDASLSPRSSLRRKGFCGKSSAY